MQVRLCDPLRQYTGNRALVRIDSADNVLELIEKMEVQYPGIERRILDDQDKVRRYVNVFLNGEVIGSDPEKVKVGERDEIYIIQSVAGG